MEIYLYFVLLLFALAAMDLIVGVSNDAVNFLNSAIGSKAASFRTILLIASLGILLGSVFSDGMMEIARSGIFNPSYFTFEQVMFILLAVMLTDIILLDFYNTLGLPTSTTVSLIFELLGASFAIGSLIILAEGETASALANYINIDSAVVIIGGIFLSVFVSFFVGSFVQYVTRIMFSFRLAKSVRRRGPLFAGIAITTIVYFLLIKGAKGSALITEAQTQWITEHAAWIMAVSLVFFTLLTWMLMHAAKINPLKLVVLLGTFSLAMAFAGNDLVNFIGVAVAGFNSYNVFVMSELGANELNMDVLHEAVKTPFWILISAGMLMVVTLWTNAKSRKVTETEIALSNQDDVDEKFKPNNFSRLLVGISLFVGQGISLLVPKDLQKKINKRFVRRKSKKAKDKPSFDLLRASVNLLTASALIAFGTSQKLPLSTTFVTFMVAMGSSFADQAWGRESAVYRVAGVLRVIGGWLMTALLAFAGSALVAVVLFYLKGYGVLGIAIFAAFLLIRSHVRFNRRVARESKVEAPIFHFSADTGALLNEHKKEIITSFQNVDDILKLCVQSIKSSDMKAVKNAKGALKEIMEKNNKLNDKIIKYISKMDGAPSSVAKNYLMVFDRMQNIHQSCLLISEVCINHVSNHHELPEFKYHNALAQLKVGFHLFTEFVSSRILSSDKTDMIAIEDQRTELKSRIEIILEDQIFLLTNGKLGNRLALLQIRILLEINDIIREMVEISKMFIHFNDPPSKANLVSKF